MRLHGPARRPERHAASGRTRLLLGLAGTAIGMTFVQAGTVLASWVSTDSSHPAQAIAATLAAPAPGTQNGAATPSSIPIKWTAPSGYTPAGYRVLRCSGSSCTSFAAISRGGCSGTISGTSCTDTDTSLTAGTTYSYEVQAQLDNWVSAPSAGFAASTSTLTRLVFTAQPASGQNIQATGTGSFSVSVAIEDASGNQASNDNTDTVTLAIAAGHNPGSGTLTCAGGLTAPVSSGVASFTGCAITKAGTGYQLTASSATNASLTAPANASSFTITAGSASQVLATSGGGQSAAVTAAFSSPLVATVEDANGNPVPGVPVTFAAPSTGASVTFASAGCTSNPQAYSCVATTAANGQATSSTFTANAAPGSYTISASAAGAGSASFSESNAATAITSLATANGGGGTAGEVNAGDTISITFSGQINASKVCSAWTNGSTGTQTASTGSVITVTNSGSGDNVLSFTTAPSACGTFNFGSIDLGSNQYVTSSGGSHKSSTFLASTISYNGTTHTLQIILGSFGGDGTQNVVASSALTLSLSTSIVDTAGNPLSSYTFTTGSAQQF